MLRWWSGLLHQGVHRIANVADPGRRVNRVNPCGAKETAPRPPTHAHAHACAQRVPMRNAHACMQACAPACAHAGAPRGAAAPTNARTREHASCAHAPAGTPTGENARVESEALPRIRDPFSSFGCDTAVEDCCGFATSGHVGPVPGPTRAAVTVSGIPGPRRRWETTLVG